MQVLQSLRRILEIRGIAPRLPFGARVGLALMATLAAILLAAGLTDGVTGGPYAALLTAVTLITIAYGPAGGLLAAFVATLGFRLTFAPATPPGDDAALALFATLSLIDVAGITLLLTSNAHARAAASRAEDLVESLGASEARFRGLLEAAPDAIVIADGQGRIVLLNAEAERMFGYDRAEMLGQSIDMLMPERFRQRHVGRVTRYLEAPATRRMGDGSDMFGRRKDGAEFPIETNLSPLANRGETLVTSVIRDLSMRQEVQERQALLVRELNHRVKNVLASVQSIVAQTLRASPAPDDFRAAFMARISALSQSHDVLTRNDWSGALVGDVVLEQISPYARAHLPFEVDGPPVMLAPNRSVTLGMVIGELATNAAKFGALSGAGSVAVSWTVDASGDGKSLRLTWREQGGPAVSPPTRQGFGSRLIQRSLAAGLQGTARLDFRPDGLLATLEFPLREGEA